jgi:shikimate dehydrogenase
MPGGLRFVLLGDPVDHSLSPLMHRQALHDAGLDGDYLAIQADRGRLQTEMERLRAGSLDGANVTMPLKGVAAELCDRFTPEAARAGAVNTMRAEQGIAVGHSTDVIAFDSLLKEWGDVPLLVLGAGGSARAALAAAGPAVVYVSARRRKAADRLAGLHERMTVLAWGAAVAGAVVINATPLGMSGERLPEGVLASASGLIDLPYGNRPTPAVTEGLSLGVTTFDGIEFLARQAAAAFTWWTGRSVDSSRLAEVARNV